MLSFGGQIVTLKLYLDIQIFLSFFLMTRPQRQKLFFMIEIVSF